MVGNVKQIKNKRIIDQNCNIRRKFLKASLEIKGNVLECGTVIIVCTVNQLYLTAIKF